MGCFFVLLFIELGLTQGFTELNPNPSKFIMTFMFQQGNLKQGIVGKDLGTLFTPALFIIVKH
jgi:hypothetical protein